MGAKCFKAENHTHEAKFIGTNQQYANLQVELTRIYKKVTGNDLVQGRLRNEQGILDVLMRLETKVFGVPKQGQDLIQRIEALGRKVDKASKYIVTSNNYTPIAGTSVSVTAQLSDAYDASVATQGVIVTWSSTTTNMAGYFSSPTSVTNANGLATVTFTVDVVPATDHTIIATSGTLTGTSAILTTIPSSPP